MLLATAHWSLFVILDENTVFIVTSKYWRWKYAEDWQPGLLIY